jgi:hypothetical protein
METITLKPKTKKELDALKAFAEALKISVEKNITDTDLKNGISVDEVKKQVHKHIDKLFADENNL